MRLLNSETLEMEEFYQRCKEEVTFQDFHSADREKKNGFKKILGCCQQAQRDRISWTWIDTCCIDKTSSAELSEAINSMYAWYRDSQVCYVFLEDVAFKFSWLESGRMGTAFEHAGWFEREKMSWASYRRTTRIEDEAYCLLGIFGVHMPLLYGEGNPAFRRLQEEIIKQTEDCSFLFWTTTADWQPREFHDSTPQPMLDFGWSMESESEKALKSAMRLAYSSKGLSEPLLLVASKSAVYLGGVTGQTAVII
ncbi:hypothetical protein QBC38DRAFT_511856 [Podospora fimiseda]|uniref:Heterokaryon incompatibility domain-containing protein n=1 Tax=Podospora fimiseda TaxID=252190 RepID=A0AAN7BJ06_9PEZI|nr:hypothetical protein QBC38DRAFT_511856 [Podospora fimiseda]